MNLLRAPLDPDAPDGGGGGAPPADPPPADLPPLIGDDLSFAEGYQERVGEHAEGANYKNLQDVFKSAKEGQRTITQLNQEKADLTKRLEESGAPAAAELPADLASYKAELKLPEMPEGIHIEDAVLDKGIEYAMEKGYTPEILADFLAFDVQRAAMEVEAGKNEQFTRIGDAKNTIIEAVGEQNFELTMANAKFAAETLGLPLTAEDLVSTPEMVLSLAKLKDSLSEGTLKGASLGGVEITNGSKLSMANDIVSDSNNPLYNAFYDTSHPQHEDAVATHARYISESGQ